MLTFKKIKKTPINSLSCVIWSVFIMSIYFPSIGYGNEILFVSDSASGANIPPILRGDGHNVTEVTYDYPTGNTALVTVSPGDYDAIIWVANGTGFGSIHGNGAVFTNLTNFVIEGGSVFVTGLDAIANPHDALLIDFIGGLNSQDGATAPGAVIDIDNALTNGMFNIRGRTPEGYYSDRDSVVELQPNTIGVVSSGTNWQWTLRTLGYGLIAFVSNGDNSSVGHASWEDTSSTGAGAYNGALRNFASFRNNDAPRIRFENGSSGELDEGNNMTISVLAEDPQNDPMTFEWDLDGDDVYDDDTGSTIELIGNDFDGPDMFSVKVKVCDTDSNCVIREKQIVVHNVAPVITNDPGETLLLYVDEEFEFIPEVADVPGDTLVVQVSEVPDDRVVILSSGGIRWTPNSTHEGQQYTLTITATDDDGAEAVLVINLEVILNTPPGRPQLTFPLYGDEVDTLRPTFTVSTPEDDQGDDLTIFFEVDLSDAFLQPIKSDPIEATPTSTSWQVPVDLQNNTRYYVRAWAFDGREESDKSWVFFWVNDPNVVHNPDADTSDANTSDANTSDANTSDANINKQADASVDSSTSPPVVTEAGCRLSNSSQVPQVPILVIIGFIALMYRKNRKG